MSQQVPFRFVPTPSDFTYYNRCTEGVDGATAPEEIQRNIDAVVNLDKQKRHLRKELEKEKDRANTAEAQVLTADNLIRDATEEMRKAKKEAQEAMTRERGESLMNLALRCRCVADHQVRIMN